MNLPSYFQLFLCPYHNRFRTRLIHLMTLHRNRKHTSRNYKILNKLGNTLRTADFIFTLLSRWLLQFFLAEISLFSALFPMVYFTYMSDSPSGLTSLCTAWHTRNLFCNGLSKMVNLCFTCCFEHMLSRLVLACDLGNISQKLFNL